MPIEAPPGETLPPDQLYSTEYRNYSDVPLNDAGDGPDWDYVNGLINEQFVEFEDWNAVSWEPNYAESE